VVKKAALLGDMHLRSLRQKMTLLQLTEESARKLEVTVTRCFRPAVHDNDQGCHFSGISGNVTEFGYGQGKTPKSGGS